MPEISVILPTRLRPKLFKRALASLLNQTHNDYEIIVVDDNPLDSRLEKFPELANLLSDKKVRVVVDPFPKNAAHARNLGLETARGEWIAYLDDDDAYRPNKLKLQIASAKQTGLPLGFSGLQYNLGIRTHFRHLDRDSFNEDELLLDLQAFATTFHKNCDIRFNEDLNAGEDAYLVYSLIDHFKINRVFNVPEILMDIYPQEGPRVNTNAEGVFKSMCYIEEKFGHHFSDLARKVYKNRAHLAFYKLSAGYWNEMLKVSRELWRLRGKKEFRLILNAWLYKFTFMRALLVG
ncbi:MAG: glycosyltransferase family 2 protein [Verrucomicrobiae bacterium]|nr:glycosyltransferase family 2 protein [Verrucomicrobiae bacterium]